MRLKLLYFKMSMSSINKESDTSFEEKGLANTENILETENNSKLEESITKSYLNINNNSEISAILNLCSSAFGAGCLSFPHCLDSIGIFNSLLVFMFVAGSIYFSLELLRNFVVDTQYSSFSVITETILGKNWLVVYSITIFICYLSVNINYMNVNYSIFRTAFKQDGYKRYVFDILFLIITFALEIFMCLYTKEIKNLHVLSMIIVLIFFVFILIIIIGGIKGINSEKFEFEKLFNPFGDKKPYDIFFEFINASILFIYGLAYHSTFPTFIDNIKPNNYTISKKINIISFGIICLSYIIISFFGYLFNKEVPEVLFLQNVEQPDNFTNTVLQTIIFVMLFCLIPFRYITIRDGYKCLITEEKFNDKIDLIITAICLFIANIIVFIDAEIIRGNGKNYNIFEIFTNIFGGFLGIIICFLLPVINYVAINGKAKFKSIIGYIISIFYILVGMLSVYYSIHKIKNSHN